MQIEVDSGEGDLPRTPLVIMESISRNVLHRKLRTIGAGEIAGRKQYQRHWPELSRLRQAKRIVTICDVCSYPVDSDQHINHCRG